MYIDYDFEQNYLWYQVVVKNSLEIVSTTITIATAMYMKTTQATKISFLVMAATIAIESLNVKAWKDYDTFVEAIVVEHNIEIYEEAPIFDFGAELVEMVEAGEGWCHFPEEMN